MGRKEKEEERIEGIIRGLLKLPENRRCINCNILGPQYVCTTFSTFVCMNCNVVHREFTHRVKSVSMSKFNAEEVSALQAAGNERARQIYFKEWNPQRNSYPDCSNLSKLRDFIKHVYVDRRYAGDNNQEKLLRMKSSNKEEFFESRMACAYHGGCRKSYCEDRCEKNERPGSRGRNDSYKNERSLYSQENSRYGNFKSTARFEVVDDRFRDGVQSGKKPDNYRLLHGESRDIKSTPGQSKNLNQSKSFMVRPFKPILGEKPLPLQVGKCSKLTDAKNPVGSAQNQRVSPSVSTTSSNGNPVEQKSKNADSLTGKNIDTKAPTEALEPQTHKKFSFSEGENSSHELSAKKIIPQAPKMTTLELLLLEFSVPTFPCNETEVSFGTNTSTTASGSNMASSAVPPGQMLMPLNSIGISDTASADNMIIHNVPPAALSGQKQQSSESVGGDSTTAPGGDMSAALEIDTGGNIPAGGISSGSHAGGTLSLLENLNSSAILTATNFPAQTFANGTPSAIGDVGIDSVSKVSNGLEVCGMQQYKPSVFAADDGSSTARQRTLKISTSDNQVKFGLCFIGAHGPDNAFAGHPSQDIPKTDPDSNSGAISPLVPVETKLNDRKKLPELVTAIYSPYSGSINSWQNGQSYSTEYGHQYYTNQMHTPAYLNPPKSTNPFDFNNETTPQQATTGNWPGAFPNTSAPQFPGQTSIFGHNSSGSIANISPSYGSAVLAHSSSVLPATSSGAYMEQKSPMYLLPSGPQQAGGNGADRMLFGAVQTTSGYSLRTNTTSMSLKGGNPFE
ncbi:hypothetical protein K2173_026009 [Erythroxylum novogranatense]|uniref:Arf-GAP domain-containing protein n=1 Tax=Erythroxylum novogranatense TaxID=1862640 RepID=A0AAV8SIK0_9ROSI|nr:hypothetical protein K2173_026009 [Erythroxylum novogranatense]